MSMTSASMLACRLTKLNVMSRPMPGPEVDFDVMVRVDAGIGKAVKGSSVRDVVLDISVTNQNQLFYEMSATAEAKFVFERSTSDVEMEAYIHEKGAQMALSALRSMLDGVTAFFPNGPVSLPDINISFSEDELKG